MTRRIVLAPVLYGFGPYGKALHIARALRRHGLGGAELVLAEPHFGGELPEPGLFDEVGTPPKAGDVLVSIMNRRAAAEADEVGAAVVFVDSLAWLWDEPLAVPARTHRYLYQDLPFLPVPERNVACQPGARPVGAILQVPEPRVAPAAPSVVLSISGVENFESSVAGGNAWYATILRRVLADAVAPDPGLAAAVTLFGNHRAVAWAGGPPPGVTLGPAGQTDFLAACHTASAVATPPGLTTVAECLLAGVPLRLLPPQNYSQVKIGAALRRTALDLPALSWSSPVLDWLTTMSPPEVVGTQIVRNLMAERQLDPEPLPPAALRALLTDGRPAAGPALVRDVLGTVDGADEVAREVLETL